MDIIKALKNLKFLARGKYALPYKWLLHYLEGSGESLEIPDECVPELKQVIDRTLEVHLYGFCENSYGYQVTHKDLPERRLEVGLTFTGAMSFYPYDTNKTQIESLCKTAAMIGSFGCEVLEIEKITENQIVDEYLVSIKVFDTYDWHQYKTHIPDKYMKFIKPFAQALNLQNDEYGWYIDEAVLSKIGKPFLSHKEVQVSVFM